MLGFVKLGCLQSVIAHELGHLKCDHGIWLSLANIFASSTVSVLPIISSAVEEGLLRYSHFRSPKLDLPVPESSRHRSTLIQVKLVSDHHPRLVCGRWLRAAELTCDRAALLVAQDPKIVISTLMKLAGGSPSLAAELNVDAFLEQVLQCQAL